MASSQAHELAEHLPILNGHCEHQELQDGQKPRVVGPCFVSYEPGPNSPDMGSSRRFSGGGHSFSGRPQQSVKQSLCDAVVKQVMQRVRAFGYSEAVCEELQGHFERLPSR